MKWILIFLLLVAPIVRADTTNHIGNITVAAAFSLGAYTVCRIVVRVDDRFGCVLSAMVISNLIMLCNIHTADSTDVLTTKMQEHAIGSSIVIPIALFD